MSQLRNDYVAAMARVQPTVESVRRDATIAAYRKVEEMLKNEANGNRELGRSCLMRARAKVQRMRRGCK